MGGLLDGEKSPHVWAEALLQTYFGLKPKPQPCSPSSRSSGIAIYFFKNCGHLGGSARPQNPHHRYGGGIVGRGSPPMAPNAQ